MGAEQVGHVELGPQAAQDEERADAEGGERDGLDFAGLVAAAKFEDTIEVLIEELFGAEGDDGAGGERRPFFQTDSQIWTYS